MDPNSEPQAQEMERRKARRDGYAALILVASKYWRAIRSALPIVIGVTLRHLNCLLAFGTRRGKPFQTMVSLQVEQMDDVWSAVPTFREC